MRSFILFIALVECVVALILYRMQLEYISLLIGAAITYLIAEVINSTRS